MEPSNLSFQLVLLHDKVVACDLELRDNFFGRGLLKAFSFLNLLVTWFHAEGLQIDEKVLCCYETILCD